MEPQATNPIVNSSQDSAQDSTQSQELALSPYSRLLKARIQQQHEIHKIRSELFLLGQYVQNKTVFLSKRLNLVMGTTQTYSQALAKYLPFELPNDDELDWYESTITDNNSNANNDGNDDGNDGNDNDMRTPTPTTKMPDISS